MDVGSILNDYATTYASATNTASNTQKAATADFTSSSSNSSSIDLGLNVQSFIQLLAVQLSNQDMYNPMSDTDFMGQLAQFTTLQVVENISSMVEHSASFSSTQYAMGLVGQDVVAAEVDSKTGELIKTQGKVTGVSYYEGTPVFYIGEKGFYLSQLMTIGEVPDTDISTDTDTSTDGENSGNVEGAQTA